MPATKRGNTAHAKTSVVRPDKQTRRKYDSPLRKQQALETRERIISAGSELVHELPTWDWKNVTAKAIGERAGVSERTVHRHFPSERELRDAVLQRMVEESGVQLDDLRVSNFASTTARMFSYLSSFATQPEPVKEPSFASIDKQRREVLLQAVLEATPNWTDHDRETAAAALDILWDIPPYERLITAWGFDAARSTDTISWMIELIAKAILQDKPPGRS